MKNIIFAFIMVLIIGLAACNTEDGPVPGANFQLALSTDVQFQSINDTIPFEIELTDDIDPFTSELELDYEFTSASGILLKNSIPIINSTNYQKGDQFSIIANELGTTTLQITISNGEENQVTEEITFNIGPNRPPVINILSHEFYVGERIPNPDEWYQTIIKITAELIDLDGTIEDIKIKTEFDDNEPFTTEINFDQYIISVNTAGIYNHTKDTYSLVKPGDTITLTVTDNDGDSSVETFTLKALDKSNIQ